jgi:hypothetical protein
MVVLSFVFVAFEFFVVERWFVVIRNKKEPAGDPENGNTRGLFSISPDISGDSSDTRSKECTLAY